MRPLQFSMLDLCLSMTIACLYFGVIHYGRYADEDGRGMLSGLGVLLTLWVFALYASRQR